MDKGGPPTLRSCWVTVGMVVVLVCLAALVGWIIYAIVTWEPAYPV